MTLLGNLLVTTDANGNETKTEYNAINAAVKQIDGEGNETTYTYDKVGRLLTETDALGGSYRVHLRPCGQSA